MLICQVFGRTEVRVHVLIAVISDERNILTVFFIERNTHFKISVYRAVENVGSPWILHIVCRSYRIFILVVEDSISILIPAK